MSETVKAIILPDTTEGGILQAEWENGGWVITVDVNTNGARVMELTYEYLPPMQDVVQFKPTGLPGEVRRLAQPTWEDGKDQ